jgi:hypothetical protein
MFHAGNRMQMTMIQIVKIDRKKSNYCCLMITMSLIDNLIKIIQIKKEKIE